MENGGTLSPGASVGKLFLINSMILQGLTIMEISKTGSTLTNDQVQVIGPVTYGGTLTVNNIGPTALTAGDQFQLFNAGGYVNSFASITLPPLAAGLSWSNRLSIDGSIAVVAAPLQFGNVVLSATNLVMSGSGGPTNATYWVLASTNVVLPRTNWTRLLTNHFDAFGNFIFSNAVAPGVPSRFYLLQVP